MSETLPGSSPELCLVMVAPPEIEEKLLDVLLAAVGNEVFTSTPSFSHGTAQGRLSSVEQVMGRSRSVQVQIIVTAAEMATLLQLLPRGRSPVPACAIGRCHWPPWERSYEVLDEQCHRHRGHHPRSWRGP